MLFVHRDQWPEEGKIVFDKVNLRYRPNTEIILRDLSFEVKPRQKIGVVGRTGAGKSTICLSLSRIVEIASGTINIDGVNISDLPLNELRRRITVIPQDPTMFTGTLRFNLDPEGIVEDERIIQLLKEAQLEDFMAKDPKGLL
jgi:ABC-type multidrug transport system fused ATPase/permease subunit